eukprot:scaffold1430_cov257-Pinguiococcus_pyrenoidosus.AAC.17
MRSGRSSTALSTPQMRPSLSTPFRSSSRFPRVMASMPIAVIAICARPRPHRQSSACDDQGARLQLFLRRTHPAMISKRKKQSVVFRESLFAGPAKFGGALSCAQRQGGDKGGDKRGRDRERQRKRQRQRQRQGGEMYWGDGR